MYHPPVINDYRLPCDLFGFCGRQEQRDASNIFRQADLLRDKHLRPVFF